MEDAPCDAGEPCDACGDPECLDWGLCDVSFANLSPVPAQHPIEARREIAAAWGGNVVDPDDVSEITLAVDKHLQGVRSPGMAVAPAVKRAMQQGCSLRLIAASCRIDVELLVGLIYPQDAHMTPAQVLAVEADLRVNELPFREIAHRHGVSEFAVGRLAQSMGVKTPFKSRKYSDEQVARVWELSDSGMSANKITKLMGLGSGAAANIMRRNAHPGRDAAAEAARMRGYADRPSGAYVYKPIHGPAMPAPTPATFEDDPEWRESYFHPSWQEPVTRAGRPPRYSDRPSKQSKYRGVSRHHSGRGHWQFALYHNGQRWAKSGFVTEEEAARAYDVKAISLGVLDRLNFPKEAVSA